MRRADGTSTKQAKDQFRNILSIFWRGFYPPPMTKSSSVLPLIHPLTTLSYTVPRQRNKYLIFLVLERQHKPIAITVRFQLEQKLCCFSVFKKSPNTQKSKQLLATNIIHAFSPKPLNTVTWKLLANCS